MGPLWLKNNISLLPEKAYAPFSLSFPITPLEVGVVPQVSLKPRLVNADSGTQYAEESIHLDSWMTTKL